MPMLSLLGGNNVLPLILMAKSVIQTNETKQRINKFTLVYMINPNLNISKSFRQQVDKCIKTIFGPITQPHIKQHCLKKMLAL